MELGADGCPASRGRLIRGINRAVTPEALDRSEVDASVDAFGKHLKGIFEHIGCADFDEDFYALRKTLSTKLADLKISDGIRQALLGHKSGNILNRHYTAQKAPALKLVLDEICFAVEIAISRRHGFPVIEGCALGAAQVYDVDIVLDDTGQVQVISVTPEGVDLPCFTARFDEHTDAGSAPGMRAQLMNRREADVEPTRCMEWGVGFLLRREGVWPIFLHAKISGGPTWA